MAKSPGQANEDPLVAAAFDPSKHGDLANAIQQLSSDEAEYFLAKLEAAIRKRKIQITGYLVAMVVWLICMVLALAYYGTHDGFVGWIFLVPFGIVGGVLFAFGKWSERVARMMVPAMPAGVAERTAQKAATARSAAAGK